MRTNRKKSIRRKSALERLKLRLESRLISKEFNNKIEDCIEIEHKKAIEAYWERVKKEIKILEQKTVSY